jgi:hypothetical protein
MLNFFLEAVTTATKITKKKRISFQTNQYFIGGEGGISLSPLNISIISLSILLSPIGRF